MSSIDKKENTTTTEIDLEPQISTILSQSQEKFGTDEVITTILSPGGKEVEITGDFDEAMKLADISRGIEYTPEEERKLCWKIDLYLMPFFIFFICCSVYG